MMLLLSKKCSLYLYSEITETFQVGRHYLVCCCILHPPVRTCDTSDNINITGPLTSIPPLAEPYVKLQRKHTATPLTSKPADTPLPGTTSSFLAYPVVYKVLCVQAQSSTAKRSL